MVKVMSLVLIALHVLGGSLACRTSPPDAPAAKAPRSLAGETTPFYSPTAAAVDREQEQLWDQPANSFAPRAGAPPAISNPKATLQRRHAALTTGDPVAWNQNLRATFRGPLAAAAVYRAVRDEALPSSVEALAPWCFSQPHLDPDLLAATGGRTVFEVRDWTIREETLEVEWLALGTAAPEYVWSRWPVHAAAAPKQPHDIRQPLVQALAIYPPDEAARWSALRSRGFRFTQGTEARRMAAGREVEALIQLAVRNFARLPQSWPEVERWSGHRLINVESAAPSAAHVSVLTNGTDAYRILVSYSGGVVEDSVIECLLLGTGGSSWKTLPTQAYQQLQASQWTTLASWCVVAEQQAELGLIRLTH